MEKVTQRLLVDTAWPEFLSVWVDEHHPSLSGLDDFYCIRAAIAHSVVLKGYYSVELGQVLIDGCGDWCADELYSDVELGELSPFGEVVFSALERLCKRHLGS